jgi:hypothetical protein
MVVPHSPDKPTRHLSQPFQCIAETLSGAVWPKRVARGEAAALSDLGRANVHLVTPTSLCPRSPEACQADPPVATV